MVACQIPLEDISSMVWIMEINNIRKFLMYFLFSDDCGNIYLIRHSFDYKSKY